MIKRRTILGAVTLAPLAGPARAQAKGDVIIATTGGLMERALQEHFYRRFESETGIRVRSVPIELPDQWARAMAGARSGNVPFDIVTATPPDLIQHKDILASVDCQMPGIRANALPGACFPTGIIRTVGGQTMVWSTKAFPAGKEPKGWADFFDVAKFPGPRALPDTGDREWWVPTIALIADGVPVDKLFPLDLDRAYRKLTAFRPHIAAWWKSGDHSMQVMRGGDAVMMSAYSSRSVPLAKSGEFDFTWNEAIRDVGNWAVLKGGPNTKNAMTFLDFFVKEPKEHAEFGGKVSSDSNNKDAIDLVPQAERKYRVSSPETWSKLVIADYEWVAANRQAMRERWTSWITT